MKRLLHVVLVWALAISPLQAGVGDHIREHIILGGIEKSTATTVNCNNSAPADSALLAASIARAAENGVLSLVPGKTCLVDSQITLLAGQTLLGNNATLKRAAQVYSTISSNFAVTGAGSTTIDDIADTSGFAVGDYVSLSSETVGSVYHYTVGMIIQSKTATTVTVTVAPAMGSASNGALDTYLADGVAETSYTFPIGSKISKVYDLLRVPTGATVRNLKINGNASEQQVAHWDLYSEIHVKGASLNDINIDTVQIDNFASEGIQEGVDNTAITASYPGPGFNIHYQNLKITNGAGNGIHLSGINHPLITNSYFYNLNSDLGVGHVGGAVSFSYSGLHATITNNYMERCYAGAGRIYIYDHSNIKFLDNTVVDMYFAGFDAWKGSTTKETPVNLLVSRNTMKNGAHILIKTQTAANRHTNNIIVSDNIMVGSQISLYQVDNSNVHGNLINNALVRSYKANAALLTSSTQVTTTATPTDIKMGMTVFVGKAGVRSKTLTVTSADGTSPVTFGEAIGTAFDSGAYIYPAEHLAMFYSPTAAATATTDTTMTLEDTTLFRVNQYIGVHDWETTPQNTTAVLRITAVNHTTGVLSLSNQLGRLFALNAKRGVFPLGGIIPTNTAAITIYASEAKVVNNDIRGNAGGVALESIGSGSINIVQGNRIVGFRTYGIYDSGSNVASVSRILGNTVIADSNQPTASWGYGIWTLGKAEVVGNYVLTNNAGQKGINASSGVDPIIMDNRVRGTATASIDTTGTTTPFKINNFANGTISADGTVAGSQVIN